MGSSKKTLNAGQIAIIMVVLTAVSKVLGLVRELLFAQYYGAGVVIDAFCMAQDIPDTVFAAVIQMVGTAFLPIYSRKAERDGKEKSDLFTSQVYNFLLTGVMIMIALCILFPDMFLSLFAPGFSLEALELSRYYLRISAFMLIGHVSVTIFEPYLRYSESHLAPVIFGFFQSLFVIVFTFISAATSEELLIYGVPAGTILQGLALIWYARRTKKFRYSPSFRYGSSVKEVFALSFPILLSSAAGRLNAFFDRMIASGFAAGSISALRYGHLIFNLISAFSYTLIGTIMYPKFNKYAAQEDYKSLSKASGQSLDYAFLLTIPLTVGGMLFSTPLVRLIYERGAFDSTATAMTSSVFFWYALGIPFSGAVVMISYVFYALQDIKPTVYCSLITVAVNAALNFLLSWLMGVEGLALATTISAVVHMVALIVLFRKRHRGIRLLSSYRNITLIVLGSILSVVGAYGLYRALGDSTLYFILTAAVAVVLYFALMLAFRVVDPAVVKDTLKIGKRK